MLDIGYPTTNEAESLVAGVVNFRAAGFPERANLVFDGSAINTWSTW